MLQHFFVRQRIDMQVVTRVSDARSILTERVIRVVLTDIFLPHADGLMLLQYVRQNSPHTRVVVMGAFSAPRVQQQAVTDGAYAFIQKPFRLHRVWTIVQLALADNIR